MSVFVTKTFYDCIDFASEKATKTQSKIDGKTIIFCEDKLSLSLEKALVEKAGGGFSAEVLSFGRYVTRIIPDRKTLSKEGSAMTVKKILSQSVKELKTFSALGASPSLASKTAELIAQLKSAKITPKHLFDCIDDCPKNISAKISDIAIVYDKYEKFLQEKGLTDSNNALEDMIVALNRDEALPFTDIIVAGFSSVTKQSCEVMKILFNRAHSCHFFAVSGENDDLYTQEFLNFAVKLTGEAPIYIPSNANTESIAILDRLFKAEDFEKVGLYSDKVHFFESSTPTEEVEYLARLIKKTVIDTNCKFSDIAIGVGSLSDYSLIIERKFADYGIPFFTDEKKKLASHPLSKLVISALKCAIRKSGMDEIKKVINNSLFISDKNVSDKIISYFTENSVTVSSFLKDLPDFKNDLDELIITSRWTFLSSFIEDFPKETTAKNFVSAIEKFISGSGISLSNSSDGYILSLANKLSDFGEEEHRSFLESGIVKFGEVLSEISNVLGEEILKSDEFYKLILSGLESSEISLIPEYLDCVYVSDLKNCRFKCYENLFAIGLSGEVPSIKADTALLVDGEITKLESLSVSIEPKIRVVNRREREATALGLCSFSKNLFVSYSLLSVQGSQITKSEIVDYLIKIFSSKDKKATVLNSESFKNNSELKDMPFLSLRPAILSLADQIKGGANTNIASRSAFYNALKTFEDGKHLSLADNLLEKSKEQEIFYLNLPVNNYFKDGRVSASTIETYYSCPYKCFLKYGVGLADSKTAEVQTRDVGNVIHDVAEKFMKGLDNVQSENDAIQKTELIFDEIFDKPEYKRFLKRPDYAYSSALLKKEAVKLCVGLYREFKNSDFRPIGMETWFSDWSDGPYKSYKLPTKTGNYKLFGKVDRIDKYKNYVRIIDYKTGKAENKIKDENFYVGQNVQLYLYMNAFAINGDKPSGAYYYSVNDNFIKEGESSTPMHGNTLSDREILLATDKDFEKNKASTIVKAKIRTYAKQGDKIEGSVVTEETLNGYMNYAKKIASSAIDDVVSGVAVPSPYKGGCAYCEFGALCGFDGESGHSEREVKGVKSETIVNAGNKTTEVKEKSVETGNGGVN